MHVLVTGETVTITTLMPQPNGISI